MGQILSAQRAVIVDTTDAWGYHSPEDFGVAVAQNAGFRKLVYLHNGVNAASILLSTLAGIVRIVAAIVLLVNLGNMTQKEARFDLKAAKRFCKMQAGRGVMELFFLGPILGTVVDGVMTCKHKELLCFSEK